MTEIQRYDWTIHGSVLSEGTGRWCLYDDVEVLLREVEQLKAEREEVLVVYLRGRADQQKAMTDQSPG